MSDEKELLEIAQLVRKYGEPAAAAAAPLVTEVRSEGVPAFQALPQADAAKFIASLVWEWRFSLPATEVAAFHTFLTNEELPLMTAIDNRWAALKAQPNSPLGAPEIKPVRYLGTYMCFPDAYDRIGYRVLWGYESGLSVGRWNFLEGTAPIRQKILDLRTRWASDPHRSESLFSPARLYYVGAAVGDPIFKLTVEALQNAAGMGR